MNPQAELEGLPGDAIVTGRLHMVWYLDPESGSTLHYLEHDTSDMSAVEIVGWLELCKSDIMRNARVGPFDEYDDD